MFVSIWSILRWLKSTYLALLVDNRIRDKEHVEQMLIREFSVTLMILYERSSSLTIYRAGVCTVVHGPNKQSSVNEIISRARVPPNRTNSPPES
jgi:hypothetical protein